MNESIIEINDDYNKIYGVRNSFMRFIKETLSLENQNKLFNSIRGSVKLTDSIRNQDGTQTIATGADYNLNQKEKEDFIYYIRNSFTHKGIPLGDTRGGYFDREGPMNLGSIKEPELLWREVALYSKKIDGNEITFKVIKWPELLIEIIEDTLNVKRNKII